MACNMHHRASDGGLIFVRRLCAPKRRQGAGPGIDRGDIGLVYSSDARRWGLAVIITVKF